MEWHCLACPAVEAWLVVCTARQASSGTRRKPLESNVGRSSWPTALTDGA